jgi:hypothetical protein
MKPGMDPHVLLAGFVAAVLFWAVVLGVLVVTTR